ncbi:MAG: TraR/DksA family transcriptional regulator [Spirochaetales bacterium]|nr:TraR/DksA family transcriptional regulator [Spirochaetales bacterium]
MYDVLKSMRGELLKNLISENEDFKAAVEDLGLNDLADVASNDIDCRTLEVLGNRDKLQLEKIDAAISRIKNGTYGICASCTKMISKDRLEAIPYAALCIDCKQKAEKNRR